jgi:hypothetical protein
MSRNRPLTLGTPKRQLEKLTRPSKNPTDRNGKPMSDEDYGLTIAEGIAFQTMTSGDPNSTEP